MMDTLYGWILPVCVVYIVYTSYSVAEPRRVNETLFPSLTVLLDRHVTCANPAHNTLIYQSKAWTCRDMRVDGHRLRYWYRVPDHSCTDAPDDYDQRADARKNDVAGLCRKLLHANDIQAPLRAAFIHDASCGHSGKERMLLVQNTSLEEEFQWELFEAGRGYMRTLTCMLYDEDQH